MYKSNTKFVIVLIVFFLFQQRSFGFEHTYNYYGVDSQATGTAAYACDVDVFPFQGNSTYLNAKTKATDANYTAIAEDDGLFWQIGASGTGDETLLWFDMKITENVASVSQIDFRFKGRVSQSSALFAIYVLKRNTDWVQTSSWIQIGEVQSVPPYSDTIIIRSLKKQISDYVDNDGNITWCIYEVSPSDEMVSVDYVAMTVQDYLECATRATPVYLPADIDRNCYVNFQDLMLFANNWLDEFVLNISYPNADINKDGLANFSDYALFANNWLQCSDPENNDCSEYWVKRTTGIWYETWYSNEGNYTWLNGFGQGSTVQMLADVNGDGKDDAIVFYNATGQWYVALSNGNGFDANSLWKTNFGQNSTRQFLADVDGDGKADSAVFYVSSGQWYVALSNGNSFGGYSLWKDAFGNNSTKQFLADVNGDGKKDAVAYYNSTGNWNVATSTGSNFGTVSQWIAGHGVGSDAQLLGDANGDGKADAVVFFKSVGDWWVSLSTGTYFATYTKWATAYGMTSTRQLLGDVNGDGKSDAVIYIETDTDGSQSKWCSSLSIGSLFSLNQPWKQNHGNGSRLMYEFSAWQGLANPYGNNLASPVVYYNSSGIWKIMPAVSYYTPDALNFWHSSDIPYVPRIAGVYKQYDSGDPNVIDEHLAMFADASIDFLLIDLTNYVNYGYIKQRALAVIQRIALWNADSRHRPLKYAIAVGWAGLTGDPNSLEFEAGVVWNDFVNNPTCPASNYFNRDGKPLLIAFGTRRLWESWGGNKSNTNHFTVHFAEGQVNADTKQALLSNGTWWTIPSVDYGKYYGWAYITGSLANSTTMVVMPGWNYFQAPLVSRVYNGVPGDFYKKLCWERVLETKPEMVIINSFNEYAEQSAVGPADSNDLGNTPRAEIWYNSNWVADPDFYWNMTKTYNTQYRTEY